MRQIMLGTGQYADANRDYLPLYKANAAVPPSGLLWIETTWPFIYNSEFECKNKIFEGTIFWDPAYTTVADEQALHPSYTYYMSYGLNVVYGDGNEGTYEKITYSPRPSGTMFYSDAQASGVSNISELKFRHMKNVNLVFLDGHTEGRSISDCQAVLRSDFWGCKIKGEP